MTFNEAKVFVTTYHIGNTKGFAHGKWFDLDCYYGADDFMEDAIDFATEELGDSDPEICFSDYDISHSFYKAFIGSSGNIDPKIWDFLYFSAEDVELISNYLEATSEQVDCYEAKELLDKAQSSFYGKFESDRDFARSELQERGDLENLPSYLVSAIDLDDVADALLQDFFSHNGYYFSAC